SWLLSRRQRVARARLLCQQALGKFDPVFQFGKPDPLRLELLYPEAKLLHFGKHFIGWRAVALEPLDDQADDREPEVPDHGDRKDRDQELAELHDSRVHVSSPRAGRLRRSLRP